MFHFRVRNGTGWGHQAMTTRLRFLAFAYCFNRLPGSSCCVCSGLCVLLLLLAVFFARLFARLCFQQADIRVARGVYFVLMRLLSLKAYQAFYQRLVTEGLIEVYWMLVALGSIHYCNYTCALSTWSSSTLL